MNYEILYLYSTRNDFPFYLFMCVLYYGSYMLVVARGSVTRQNEHHELEVFVERCSV